MSFFNICCKHCVRCYENLKLSQMEIIPQGMCLPGRMPCTKILWTGYALTRTARQTPILKSYLFSKGKEFYPRKWKCFQKGSFWLGSWADEKDGHGSGTEWGMCRCFVLGNDGGIMTQKEIVEKSFMQRKKEKGISRSRCLAHLVSMEFVTSILVRANLLLFLCLHIFYRLRTNIF